MKVLMVCLGNICRSPLAEGILREMQPSWEIDSAGTAGYHIGSAPDPRMISTAAGHQIDISMLRARQFTSADFDAFDRIYAMDSSNYTDILSLASSAEDRAKVQMMLGEGKNVPDPYYGGDEGFETVYQLLHTACQNICNE